MKTHQLMALVTVADTGTVRSAARVLNVSPAAITKSLQQLEEQLQASLMTRTPAGVTLTECGKTLLVHARLMLRQMASAREAVEAMRGDTQARLTVAVTPWIAMTFLPDTVRRFRQRMPKTTLEFFDGLLSIANPRLRDGSLDLFIGRPTPGTVDVDFSYRPLFSSSCAVVARREHPAAQARSLAELLEYEWLLAWDPAREGSEPGSIFARAGLPIPQSVHLVHSVSIANTLLRHTDMLSLLPWPLVEFTAASEKLCAIPVREELEDATVSVITHNGRPPGAASECFVECLIETIRHNIDTATGDMRRVMHSVEWLL
jgi:LysR family transcriptional regulator, regulator of abg operon